MAGRDDDLDLAGGAIHEQAERLVAGTALCGVPVLEHEDDRTAVRELFDEERKPRLGDRSRPCGERHERALTYAFVDFLERGDHVGP